MLYAHEKGRLFAQLVDLLQFYEGFEINDHSGTQLSDDDVLQAHYSRFQAFQLLAFKEVPKVSALLFMLLQILYTDFLDNTPSIQNARLICCVLSQTF